MSDITVTAANVRPLNGAIIRRGTAGGTLTPGQIVYLDGANGWKAADASAAASGKVRGLVLSDGNGAVSFASGQTVDILLFGPVEGFASMTPGAAHYLSETAGAINTAAPSTASAVDVVVGWAESATVFFFSPEIVIGGTAVADLSGTLTGTVNGAMVDVAAAAGACGGGATPANTDVDTAIATAVATIVSGVNEQNKEMLTKINAILAALRVAGVIVN
jgi:hypothetical protein